MKIGIVGLGWLGMPLAETFVNHGHSVIGTKRKADIHKKGIEIIPFEWGKTPLESMEKLFIQSDVLIFNLPPSAIKSFGTDAYAAQFAKMSDDYVRRAILISSTGVFGNMTGRLNENDTPKPETESGKFLLEWERFWAKALGKNAVILRPGGLVGSDRHPINFLKGRTGLRNPNHPVNLVYQDDLIGLIIQLCELSEVPPICHAVAPNHPTRQDYYTWAAEYLHLPKPEFVAHCDTDGKLIESTFTAEALNYKYHFDDPYKMC